MKYAQPGDKHKFLENLAGTWDAHVKMRWRRLSDRLRGEAVGHNG